MKEQAYTDIDTLVYNLETTHPNLYAVVPKNAFTDSVHHVKINLPDSLSVSDFFKRVAPLVTMLGDGHTSFMPPPSPSNRLLFPIKITVDANDSTMTIAGTGKQILSVNDVSNKELIGNMLRYFSGENIYFRTGSLQQMFPIVLADLYPAEKFKLRISENGVLSEEIVAGQTSNEIQNSRNISSSDKADYSYKIISENNMVVFTFNKFNDINKFKEFLNGMFAEIREKKIKNLVIDVRNNGGGNSDLGDELFQYISPVPFVQFGKVVFRISPILRKNFPEINKQIYEDGFITFEATDDDLIPLRENPMRYVNKGNTYLLTDISTFSSASSFAWLFKYLKMGTVIGRETGGQAVSFGEVIHFILPHSRLRVNVSCKKFYLYGARDEDNHGTIPDINIPADEALDYVLKYIGESTN